MEAIVVHAGAGSGKYPADDRRFAEMRNAVEAGRSALRKGSALDAVEAAVRHMEGSGAFNAGRGSCLTADGRVEMDAAIMGAGRDERGAGVAVVTCTYHPVSLARWVMERTPHVLIAGERCREYLKAAGMRLDDVSPSQASLAKFKERVQRKEGKAREGLWRGIDSAGTVGAVALDAGGKPAAAVSTGGMWLKLPGRVGDSAVVGAGLYADPKSGAACATGTGEEIIRSSLCMRACGFVRESGAPGGARRAIELITKASGRGTAGIITVDLKGRVGRALNTEAMGTAWYDYSKGRTAIHI